jgi:type IV secretory pathway TraG/TraD family ATPase VirD4
MTQLRVSASESHVFACTSLCLCLLWFQTSPEPSAKVKCQGGTMGTLAVTIQRFLSGVILFFNWIIASFYRNRQLHNARFARIDELASLLSTTLEPETSLLLGASHFTHVLRVRPTDTRRELGNLLIVAPTRGGKGLLATSQLLTCQHSVVVNDIKGELFTQTAGYRSTLGKVFVIDPTGVGHRYDPLLGKQTEDALLSSATHLLFKPDEGEGAIFTQRATVMLTQLLLAARAERHAPLPYVRQIIRSGLATAAETQHNFTRVCDPVS